MNTNALSRVSIFGIAMATLTIAPELQADVIDLTFSPETNADGAFVNINELIGTNQLFQWNDTIGKTIRLDSVGGGSIVGLTPASVSMELNASTFSGTSIINNGSGLTAYATGIFYIGFITAAGNVGWFSMDLGSNGPITYLAGEYGTDGESVRVGGNVPAPPALALLALGAVGLRRHRQQRQVA